MLTDDERAFIEALGREVRRHRKRRGMTQDALAKASGVSKRQITNVETGRTGLRLSSAVALARALEVSVDDLLEKTP